MAKRLNNPVDTALFDKETLEAGLKKIELVRPDRQGLRDVEMALEQRFSKAELEKMAEVFKQAFGKCAFVCMQPNGITAICDEAMQIYNNLARKGQLATALGWLLCEPQNVKAYVDTLTQPMKNLWRHVLVNAFVTEEEAMEILGISTPMLTTQRYSYYYERPSMTRTEYDLFTTVSGRKAAMGDHYYRESCTYISVKSVIYYHFFPVFFPEAYDTGLSVAALPYESPMVLDFENESTAKYTLLNSLIKTGKLPMGAKSVSQADIKRVAKQMGLLEFFPSEQHTLYGNLRSRYYIETLALANHLADNKTKKKWTGLHDVLRFLLQDIGIIDTWMTSFFFPHIKGLRKQMVEYNKLEDICDGVLEWFGEEPERWIPISDLFMKTLIPKQYGGAMLNYAQVFLSSEQKNDVEIVNELTGEAIGVDRYVQEFGYTALQAFAFMLCSLGVVEIGLSPLKRNNTPFARAEYVRLTALGRYALGLSDVYEIPEPEHTAYFELDPDRLIIRSLIDPNPYAQLLLDTSVAISRNRFETSAQSFLAHCASRKDVEEKIGIFQQFVSHELPPLWKQFFDSLLQHCNPLKKEYADYYIYSISPDNTDLIRLLTGTPSLRKMFVRAEGYLILIRKVDQKKFMDELKKYGYLL